jgi:hypothetical protein
MSDQRIEAPVLSHNGLIELLRSYGNLAEPNFHHLVGDVNFACSGKPANCGLVSLAKPIL